MWWARTLLYLSTVLNDHKVPAGISSLALILGPVEPARAVMIASQHPLACSIIYVAIKANLLFGYNVLQLQPLAGQISNWKCEVLGGISRLVYEVMSEARFQISVRGVT